MSNSSIKISDSTMKRLRKHLSKKYEGEIYGKIGETVDNLICEYLDKQELKDGNLVNIKSKQEIKI